MKILSLRFKNLNSLVGEWHIDFTDDAYAQSGIFAITGPTGTGKTTVLDALCLALYGRTPRLSRVNKSGNEIMSRQAGECFSEVMFETLAGRFIGHWSQRRARLRPDGELQGPRHEIAHAYTGKVIEAKIKDVAGKIIDITGMDFDRFTRSMLLAQGGFAAFLDATPDERSPILEQITGTEIYSRISVAVHERQRMERDKLERCGEEIKGIVVLSEDKETFLQQEIDRKTEEANRLAEQQKEIKAAIDWLRGIEAIRKEIVDIEQQTGTLQMQNDAFALDREKWQLSCKAATLDGEFKQLSAARRQNDDDAKQLAFSEDRLRTAQNRFDNEKKALSTAEETLTIVTALYQESLPVLRQVRELDLQIGHTQKDIDECVDERKRDESLLAADCVELDKVQAAFAAAGKDLERVGVYLVDHAADAVLVTDCDVIIEKINTFITGEIELKKITDASAVQKKRAEAQKKLLAGRLASFAGLQDTHRKELSAVEGARDSFNEILAGKLLREYRAEYGSLLREQLYLQKIADLETHRRELEDGKPCPLCGATVHPFAQGNVPGISDLQQKITALSKLIQKAEEGEKIIADLEETARKTDAAVREQERILTRLQSENEHALQESVRLSEETTAAAVRCETMKVSVLQLLGHYGVADLSGTDSEGVIAGLRRRRDLWRKAELKKRTVETRRAELTAEINRLDGRVEMLRKSAGEKREKMQLLTGTLEHLTVIRTELFDGKNADEEETRLKNSIHVEEKALSLHRSTMAVAEKDLTAIQTSILDLKERIARQAPELESLGHSFTEHCRASGFETEASFLAACLPAEVRDRLAKQDKELEASFADCRSRKSDREKALHREIDKCMTGRPLSECVEELRHLDSTMKSCSETIGADKQRLLVNTTAKEKSAEKRILFEAQQKECLRWDNLHALIGSSDGKKYRNFAQGITFEILLSHANSQLQKLTDRYLLTIEKSQPLELFVIDSYQAGEVRSARNLSGGESFIVSMALALGLSNMSSNKVRVDSLFLDEGFGTLDEDSLETALETLAELKQEGKLIGVISHVSALRERISTQICVIPVSGGKSVISGPGCRKCS